MSGKNPKKFDPARARVLDVPERERDLPTDETVPIAGDGFVLVIDWERGRGRDLGPPDDLLHDAADATAALADAGLRATPAPVELPFHFALNAAPTE